MSKYWNTLNWLIAHRLKYLALFIYGCVSAVTLPFIWGLKLLLCILESREYKDMSTVVNRIIKGEKV